MAIGVIYTCDVCGCEVTSYSGHNYDSTFRVANGNKPADNYCLCPDCTDMVIDYIDDLKNDFIHGMM